MPTDDSILVLGAGAFPGYAFHLGVLAALEDVTGAPAAGAGLLVGTSIGAVTAATLRAGFTVSDLVAHLTGGRMSSAGDALVDACCPGGRLPPPVTDWRLPRPSVGVRAGWRGLRRTSGLAHAAGAAVTGLAPTGRSSLVPVRDALDAAHPGGWPDGTWMVTWDVSAGRRVVLGRDVFAEVGAAASAAAAVPGVFAPVALDGARLVDAGAVSSTHADLVADRHAGLVLVSAPMAVAQGAFGGIDAPARWLATRQLSGEVSTLRAAGHDPVVLAPSREVLRAMPANPLVDDRVAAARVVAATRPWARERIEAHLAGAAAGGRRVA